MATDFRALLEVNDESVPRPKGIPECWMVGKIGKHNFDNVKSEKQTPYCRFEILQPEPHPETDQEILDTIAALEPPLSERSLHFDAFMTSAAMRRFTALCTRLVGHPNLNLTVRVPQTQGQRVMFKVVPQFGKDGEENGFNSIDIDTVTLAK